MCIQKLASRIVSLEAPSGFRPRFVGGLDVAYSGGMGVAALVVQDLDNNTLVNKKVWSGRVWEPYVSGFLFIREAPLMLRTLHLLDKKPDLLFVDGHGIAHPRRAGLSVFVGLCSGIPTVGVAKSLLAGRLGEEADGVAPIFLDDVVVGYAVKSASHRRFYVSPGNLLSADDVSRLIDLMGRKYPLSLTEAHRFASAEVKDLAGH